MIEKKSKWGKRGTVNFYFSFLAVICSKYLTGTLVQQEKLELLTLGVIGSCENVSIPLKCKYVYVRIYHK